MESNPQHIPTPDSKVKVTDSTPGVDVRAEPEGRDDRAARERVAAHEQEVAAAAAEASLPTPSEVGPDPEDPGPEPDVPVGDEPNDAYSIATDAAVKADETEQRVQRLEDQLLSQGILPRNYRD